MKETIYTIPLSEAFDSGDECPFCQLERAVEQRTIRYVLGPGASYMEPDVRAATDAEGFCGAHFKKMYDYGNSLGSALMMQTWLNIFLEEMDRQMADYEKPARRSFFRKKTDSSASDAFVEWMRRRNGSCYLCEKVD